ncbi:MAG: hypothetical protein JAZ18_15095 [Candidatus Thiodiazotropha endolucinida]|nr:hypothetical protein [Candidatus Thiodiazotropha endolucinida]
MMQPSTLFLLLILFMPIPVAAGHAWAEIDLCEAYKDKLPPDLTAERLPEAHSPGAELLDRYCTQCHNLPGPDRHTLAEWHDVTTRMFTLMDVAHRFGGVMGRVETMQPQARATLVAYLQRHAGDSGISHRSGRNEVDGRSFLKRLQALIPLLLVGLGLVRWWRKDLSDHRPWVIER